MEILLAGSAAFLLTHLGISGTPLRAKLQSAMGAQPYLGLYSLLAFGSLGLMIYGYAQLHHADFIWYPSVAAYNVTKVLLLISLVVLVMGTLTANPTQVMNEKALDAEDKVIEEGYGSVDEDEKPSVDKKQVVSNPG